MKRLTLALAFAALIPIANAVEYTQIQTDKSTINFVYKQMGVAVDGKFKKFSSQLSFDPAKPTAAKASFDVELGSVDTGAPQDVVVPATFTAQGNAGVFDGSFTIRRADFAIGEGSWAKFDIVANDVQIKFRITASSK